MSTLQTELGHSTPQMTQRYMTIYDKDISSKHQQCSPGSQLSLLSKSKPSPAADPVDVR
jgi:hypothetical protein